MCSILGHFFWKKIFPVCFIMTQLKFIFEIFGKIIINTQTMSIPEGGGYLGIREDTPKLHYENQLYRL